MRYPSGSVSPTTHILFPTNGRWPTAPTTLPSFQSLFPVLYYSGIDYREQRMTFVSLTRLRIRSFRFVPLFALHTWRSIQQIRRATGFQTGAVLADRSFTFWTMTAWESEESMRAFMLSGSHKIAMTHLMDWCDEASVSHWSQPETQIPSWIEADRRMRECGRPSKVRNPSPHHATLNYRPPRTTGAVKITRSRAPAAPSR
jgi:Domain of unknown function (DUF3291)